MADRLAPVADALLREAVEQKPGLPGVVAIATDRHGDVYRGAAGSRAPGSPDDMDADTVLAVYSTTKAVTATVALQLVERGRLDLDAPARDHVPEIGECQVLEGFGPGGELRLRAPRREITTRMLMSHTAGFGYDFFNADYARLTREHGYPGIATARFAALRTPLLFDPGERWEYSSSIDWVGLIVEAIAGKRLGEVMRAEVFEPLGMDDTGFSLSPRMQARRAAMHRRLKDGSLEAMPGFELPREPEIQMGGHGLYSTASDYAKFIRMWLNDGRAPNGERLLTPAMVDLAVTDQLGGRKITPLVGAIPAISNDVEFFAGVPKSWSLSFMINEEAAPTGRQAGSLGWAGLANLYYWIDRRSGIGGFWATQLFPFADTAALEAALAFEKAVYDHLPSTRAG